MEQIHLQGIGLVNSKPAVEIDVGDTLIWNYGYKSTVTAIVKYTPKQIVIEEVYHDSNKSYKRRLSKKTLVGIDNNINL